MGAIPKFMLVSLVLFTIEGQAQSIPLSRYQMSHAMHNAHTPEEHARVAALFRKQEVWYREQEKTQEDLLREYQKQYQNHSVKYPTRGDIAHQRAVHYGLEARHAADLAMQEEDRARHPAPAR